MKRTLEYIEEYLKEKYQFFAEEYADFINRCAEDGCYPKLQLNTPESLEGVPLSSIDKYVKGDKYFINYMGGITTISLFGVYEYKPYSEIAYIILQHQEKYSDILDSVRDIIINDIIAEAQVCPAAEVEEFIINSRVFDNYGLNYIAFEVRKAFPQYATRCKFRERKRFQHCEALAKSLNDTSFMDCIENISRYNGGVFYIGPDYEENSMTFHEEREDGKCGLVGGILFHGAPGIPDNSMAVQIEPHYGWQIHT